MTQYGAGHQGQPGRLEQRTWPVKLGQGLPKLHPRPDWSRYVQQFVVEFRPRPRQRPRPATYEAVTPARTADYRPPAPGPSECEGALRPAAPPSRRPPPRGPAAARCPRSPAAPLPRGPTTPHPATTPSRHLAIPPPRGNQLPSSGRQPMSNPAVVIRLDKIIGNPRGIQVVPE